MNIVLSLGGSLLGDDFSAERIRSYAAMIHRLHEDDHRIGVVVGGGTPAREYISIGRELGANEIALDYVGIDVTRLNARLMIAAIPDAAVSPPSSYEEAGSIVREGQVCVMGGVSPGHTTDAVSAALAEFIGADLLVVATSVPGVYEADPRDDPEAKRYDELSVNELVRVVVEVEMAAGSSTPLDLLAAKIIQRSGIRAFVLDGRDPASIETAIRTGAHEGTTIVPEAASEEPAEWRGHRNS